MPEKEKPALGGAGGMGVWITKPHHSKLSSNPNPDFPGVTNEFPDKNEQASLDACGAIGVKPIAMVNTQKKRYPVAEF
jgi:hypothetical protein